MAIYHCSMRVFSRSKGHSAVAAAAYRSGSILPDDRLGTIHRYDKRAGIADTFILLPQNSPFDPADRAVLWNAAELAERRKNSCVARELVLALPHELSCSDRRSLTHEMASWLKERYRVAVDAAIHIPVHGDDARNHHAHLLFTTREVVADGMGRKTRILDDKVTGKEETELIREVWETLANDALARAGFSDVVIDRRTLEEQGVDRIPQTHIGPKAQKASSGSSEDEGERGEGESGKKGSSGGGQSLAKKTKGKAEGEEGEDDKGGKGGSGDAVALKLESKLKKDHKGRDIDYRVIDRLKTRQNFVDEIKALNERRAAFGETPIKEQIKEIDALMDKLDARLERLQALEDKTSFPAKVMELIEQAAHKAAELLGLRKQEGLFEKLSEAEDKAREERHHARYGRAYRRGLHTQIVEMKSNIERLEIKQAEVKRYSAFVEKLEQEILKHAPEITKEVKAKAEKPVRKTSNAESSLKLKLQASVMRESLPLEQSQVQVKRPAQEQTSSPSQSPVTSTEFTTSIKEPLGLKETARVEFEPSKTVSMERAYKAFNSEAEKLESIRREQDYKTKNSVVFKALEQVRATREPIQAEKPSKEEYRQPVKTQISALKNEAEKRGPEFLPDHKQVARNRAEARAIYKERLGVDIGEKPKRASTGSVVSRMKSNAEQGREKVPPQYKAQSYEAREATPKETKESFNQAHSRSANPSEAPSVKMSAGFNAASNKGAPEPPEPEDTLEDHPDLDVE